ncbi:MAG: DUF481 domain-containing protein [Xanthomonadales bacterium]|nr:DUF481 domain-containing protein [Xanthomonadales bacterium]
MRRTLPLVAALSLVLSAHAQAGSTDGWTGTGELGLAMARGNARSENLNTKLAFINEDDRWKHEFGFAALRAKGEVTGDFDGDGVPEERFELNANRYEFSASSALKVNERSSWVASLRYENDDFAPFEHQSTFAIGYGHSFIDSEATKLRAEVGPGYRRAKNASTGETESDGIVRGLIDYSHQLTATTKLGNHFLIESGSDNTFMQNDFGLSVAINSSFALKAGLQVRHNTEVAAGRDKTDTLTTVNLVYTIK